MHVAIWVADENGRRTIEHVQTRQLDGDPTTHAYRMRAELALMVDAAISDAAAQTRALASTTHDPIEGGEQ